MHFIMLTFELLFAKKLTPDVYDLYIALTFFNKYYIQIKRVISI